MNIQILCCTLIFSDVADGLNKSGNTVNAQNRGMCKITKKSVEIPPCGLRYISKPGRPGNQIVLKCFSTSLIIYLLLVQLYT